MSLSYATVAVLYGCVEVIRPSNVVDKVAVEKKLGGVLFNNTQTAVLGLRYCFT